MPKSFTYEELKKIAKEYLNAIKSKTDMPVKSIEVVNEKALLAVIPDWQYGTSWEDKGLNPDYRYERRLNTLHQIEDILQKKYGISFEHSDHNKGKKIAGRRETFFDNGKDYRMVEPILGIRRY